MRPNLPVCAATPKKRQQPHGQQQLDEAERMAETDVPSYRLEVSIVGSASSVGDDRNDFHPLGRTAGAPLGLHWGRCVWISR
ncbi:hypothetical protein I4J10_06255 [Corynebacterium diphtheriae bv. mitis]|nr:hypothetical protein [Corynebacterium diphtheriae bv. mitis]MBG9353030.1 hypothetical protein [Corynebacterium diphtheriae bv. gravis]CAB0764351.1 hypothetical protein FRC0132_02229 [Corynebacterium diphtheriae]CAB0922210.1 hypothetical protein FRC0425_02403 [Corynebacterium diphtheriae]